MARVAWRSGRVNDPLILIEWAPREVSFCVNRRQQLQAPVLLPGRGVQDAVEQTGLVLRGTEPAADEHGPAGPGLEPLTRDILVASHRLACHPAFMSARDRKLPRGRSWPLTRTDITDALGSLTDRVGHLHFHVGSGAPGAPLGVSWRPATTANYGRGGTHPSMVGFHVSVSSVAASDRAVVRAALKAHGLPQMCEWINRAVTADETWQQGPHQLYWVVIDGQVATAHEK